MIGLVLVTHGALADQFVCATEHVVGPQRQLKAVGIGPDDDVELRRRDILDAVQSVDGGQGVIVLTDMFGGTPSNLSISIMEKADVEVIAGLNLPMLIKLATLRACANGSGNIKTMAAEAQTAGRKYITIASTVLEGAIA